MLFIYNSRISSVRFKFWPYGPTVAPLLFMTPLLPLCCSWPTLGNPVLEISIEVQPIYHYMMYWKYYNDLYIKPVNFLCTDSILLMLFFLIGDQIWVLCSSLGWRYNLNSFCRLVAEQVLKFFYIWYDEICVILNKYFMCSFHFKFSETYISEYLKTLTVCI